MIYKKPLTASDFKKEGRQKFHDLFERQRDDANHLLYDTVMGYIGSGGEITAGDYFEFGICGAGQFRLALSYAHRWGLDAMKFVAFDSFKGLPATGHLTMSEDSFRASIGGQGLGVDRVETVSGYYEDSLTPALQEQFVDAGRQIAFVNVDCDLHESAEVVLRFIEPMMKPGSVIYLDDFYASFPCGTRDIHGGMWGTARAFFDFNARSKLKYYPFMTLGYWGRSFIAYDPDIPSGPAV